MSLGTTLVGLTLAAAVALAAALIQRRPPPLGSVRLVPYAGVQFVALVVAVLLLAHLVTLLSGQPLRSRFGF